jgi:molybdenum cofactor cytidylyltransferase
VKLGAVILAAGAASRLGAAKMLLPYSDKTILEHIVKEVQALNPASICLVTGKYTDQIKSSMNFTGVELLDFPDWELGMAASIKFGLQSILAKLPSIDAILFVVSDQPFLDRLVLNSMINAFQTSAKGIVAARYQLQNGTPVIFHRSYFEQILQLQGDKGAKKIVDQHLSDLVTVDFPLGAMDIDTQEDYVRFQELLNKQDVN